MLLQTHAPWNMIKGKDSSCLCINCEGTNAVSRGSKAVMRMIKPIVILDEPNNDDGISEESVHFNVEGQPEHFTSEVQNKMIIMEHQISSCHVPVVRSFFIL
jgi:hypothetical protein